MEEQISGIEDKIEEIDTRLKENLKSKNPRHKHSGNLGHFDRKKKLWIIEVEEGEETQTKGTENIFNKTIEENFPNLKKVVPIKAQEA